MTQTHKSQIEIRASARRVFELLSDPNVLIGGLPMMKRVEHCPDGPMRRGTRLRIFADGGEGEEIQVEAEITEFIPPRVIESAGYMSLRRRRNRAVSRYEIEQYGAVTKLVVTSRVDVDSWGQWLLWPVTRLVIDWAAKRQLKHIKDIAEAV